MKPDNVKSLDLPNINTVVVCGGRDLLLKKGEDINDPKILTAVMERTAKWSAKLAEALHNYEYDIGGRPIAVIHGGARGADWLAGEVAKALGYQVFVFHAGWEGLGKSAGPIRNQAVANAADYCIALPGGDGTSDMVKRMREQEYDGDAIVVEIKE